MPLSEDIGIITHCIRYSETSLIVTWLTQKNGIIKTLAKGALRPRQAMSGKIDLFHECHFAFKRSRASSLHSLSELDVVNPHPHVRSSYPKLICMTYFYELASGFAETDTAFGNIYETFHLALDYLKEHEVSALLVERFERKLLKEHGIDDGVTPAHRLMAQFGMKIPQSRDMLYKELEK